MLEMERISNSVLLNVTSESDSDSSSGMSGCFFATGVLVAAWALVSLSVGSGNFLFLGGINLQATEEAGLAGPLQYYLTGMQQLDNLNGKLTLEQCDPILLDPKTEG